MSRSIFSIYSQLSKLRICIMQLVTFSMGFFMASSVVSCSVLGWGLLGTFLSSAGAGALNHWMEVDVDKKMKRTSARPLPLGEVSPFHASMLGSILVLLGLWILLIFVNQLTALLCLLTVFLYVAVYTPMKRWSWLNTLVGAVPGAIPPLGGWAAVTNTLTIEAWILFIILFIWQLPHFYAISWMFKDDYEAAGLKMISVGDTTGGRTAFQIVFQTVLLLVVSFFPVIFGMLGMLYAVGMGLMGLVFLYTAIRFFKDRSVETARLVLRASIIYLPVWLALIFFSL